MARFEVVRCGAFIGIQEVTISGGAYTDSYNSNKGSYVSGTAGDQGDVCSDGLIFMSGGSIVNGDAHPGEGETVEFSGWGAVVTGSTKPRSTPLDLPPVDPGDVATNNDSIPLSDAGKKPLQKSGDFRLNGGDHIVLGPGMFYFKNLKLTGGSSFSVIGPTVI